MRMVLFFLCSFLISCGGVEDNLNALTKPLTSDSKIAIVIKRYQYTTCKTTCLVDERVVREYENFDTGEAEEWLECPLDYTEFLCIDLYKQDGEGKNVVYKLSPQDWQKEAAHLFGYYAHSQVRRGIAQIEFLCDQDFAACEDHFEPIKALIQFHYERQ